MFASRVRIRSDRQCVCVYGKSFKVKTNRFDRKSYAKELFTGGGLRTHTYRLRYRYIYKLYKGERLATNFYLWTWKKSFRWPYTQTQLFTDAYMPNHWWIINLCLIVFRYVDLIWVLFLFCCRWYSFLCGCGVADLLLLKLNQNGHYSLLRSKEKLNVHLMNFNHWLIFLMYSHYIRI